MSYDVALDLLPDGSARLGVRDYYNGPAHNARPETKQIGTWSRVGSFIVVDSGTPNATDRLIYLGKEIEGVLCFQAEPRRVGPGEFVPGPQTAPGSGDMDGQGEGKWWGIYEMERSEAKQ